MKLDGVFPFEKIGSGILCVLGQVQKEIEIPVWYVRMFIEAQNHMPQLPSTEMSIFNILPQKKSLPQGGEPRSWS